MLLGIGFELGRRTSTKAHANTLPSKPSGFIIFYPKEGGMTTV